MATIIERPIYEVKINKKDPKKEPVADKKKIDELIKSLSQYHLDK